MMVVLVVVANRQDNMASTPILGLIRLNYIALFTFHAAFRHIAIIQIHVPKNELTRSHQSLAGFN